MTTTVPHLKLTVAGAMQMLAAGMTKATTMGQPQCISIVDDGCNLLAYVRMDGAKILSENSSRHKAMTAASSRAPTGEAHAEVEIKLALATSGEVTNLKGGLPIIVDGHVIGGIGVGSGTGDQDRVVADAALAALPGAKTFGYA